MRAQTTGNTLALTTYHVLASPPRLQKLKEELSQICLANPCEVISYKKLEALPYLSACINEGLRLGTGVSGRLPRINRTRATRYKDHILPPGTPISMTIRDLYYQPDIFHNPHDFNPERWLDLDVETKRHLEKYLVLFSRGPRACVGKNLAMAELQMVIGNLFSRFDMELYKTGVQDVAMAHDFFARLD